MTNKLIKLFFPVLLFNLAYNQHGFTASPPSHDMSSSGMSPQSLIVPQDITPQGVKIKIPVGGSTQLFEMIDDPYNNNIITHNINTNPLHSLVIPGVDVFSISNDKGGGV